MVWALLPFSTIAAAPVGPKAVEVSVAPLSLSGGDRVQWLPLSADQAASTLAAGPLPAFSSATVRVAVRVAGGR